jgi:hypothetical protein
MHENQKRQVSAMLAFEKILIMFGILHIGKERQGWKQLE